MIFEPEENEVGLRTNLDLLEGKREQAKLRSKAFQERASKGSIPKMKLKNIAVGDLVLRQAKLRPRRPKGGVFNPN